MISDLGTQGRELDRQTDRHPPFSQSHGHCIGNSFVPHPGCLPRAEGVQQPLRAASGERAGVLSPPRGAEEALQHCFLVGWVTGDPAGLAVRNRNKQTTKKTKPKKNPHKTKKPKKTTKQQKKNQQKKKINQTNGDIGRERQVSVSSNEM